MGTPTNMTVCPPRNHAQSVKLVQRGCPSQRTIAVWPQIKPHDRAAKCFTKIRQTLARGDEVGRELDSKIRTVISHDCAPSRADMIDYDTDTRLFRLRGILNFEFGLETEVGGDASRDISRVHRRP